MTLATIVPIIGIVARTGTFPLYDRLTGGTLAKNLASMRADGKTYLEIAVFLRNEHGIDVSLDTVRRWCIDATGPEAA